MNITNLLIIHNQLRIFHWQTTSFAEHEAFGKTYESLSGKIDEFVEVFMGKYGRIYKMSNVFEVNLCNYSSESVQEYIAKTVQYLTFELLPEAEFPSAENSELLNLRDEMLSDINKLKYLLSLH